ncbi:MAG: RloB domain-containing protein [Myxococcales bacterium]|nr:RloB domain-containing protein [Myxococcales bacterium]
MCEGEVTEVAYFEAFPVNRREVHVAVEGEGKNTTSLVAAAVEHADRAVEAQDPFDEAWVVYDHDDFGAERFNQAEDDIRALDQDAERRERWHAAWSNQAFEVWYLLHFQFFDGKLHRHLVQRKLGELLRTRSLRPRGYRKNDPDLYRLLLPLQADAIKHAKRLEQEHGVARHAHVTPAQANPCTMVYRLVEALNAEIP